MSRNPYHIEGQDPSISLSVFAYMDILGYADLPQNEELLRSLHTALTAGRNWLEEKDLDEETSAIFKQLVKKDRFALKAFTDNIVIGWPIRDDAESELGDAFGKLTGFQFRMVLSGFFVRGALTIGQAYVDEIAVFGSALVESYRGESKLARDPRIILTPTAIEACKKHLTYYGNARHAPHVREVLRDSDGQWFLNYLDNVLIAEDEHGPFYEELLKHKAVVEARLTEHKSNPAYWAKYAWVAGYHNYFCDLHGHHFGDEHKIDVELFRASPSLIVD